MLMRNKLKGSILLLCDDSREQANTVLDHIYAFKQFSRSKIYLYNPRGLSSNVQIDLDEFDAIVIHYSLPIIHKTYISHDLLEKIHSFQGLKIQYIQDDYRQVNEYTEMMRYLGIHVLFTPYTEEKIPLIYDSNRLPNVTKFTTLTGYVPDRYKNLKPTRLETRPIDVGYRGRDIPFWLGRLSQEKVWIGQGFLEHTASYGLKCDIAWREEDRIYGKRWDYFIGSCKAMLGTESGASITDFDGRVEKKTREYLRAHPSADFRKVYEQVLKDYEGNLVENTISPRVFECAGHRTAMILFPGEYSGIIRPWEHYIPLEKDFSNIDEVIVKLRDAGFLRTMTDRAYTELIASGKYSYRTMVQAFDEIVLRHFQPHIALRQVKYHFWLVRIKRWTELFLR